ncbi:hypothetical protein LCE31_16105, partial [Streptomyces sp. 8L]|nr:hypothetical protein [Streptomyces sp. 8L]
APPAPPPAPEAAPAAPAAPPAVAPLPEVDGDLSRLPQWAQRVITESQTAARTAAVQSAIYHGASAAGADAAALLDSRSFMASLDAVDPSDSTAITAAITAAVTTNPRLAVAPVPTGPARAGAEFAGPPAQGEKRAATLQDAIAAKLGG